MVKKVVFLEFKEEFSHIQGMLDDQLTIVAMHPSVEVVLQRHGLKYKSSSQYFGKEGHASVLEKSNLIINLIRPLFSSVTFENVIHAYERTSIFHTRFYLHYLLANIHIINKVVEEVKPNSLVVLSSLSPDMLDAPLGRNDSILGPVISYYANCHGIKVLKIKHKKTPIHSTKKPKLWWFPLSFNIFLWLLFLFGRRKNLLIAPNDTCNMPKLLDQVAENMNNSIPVYLSIMRKSLGQRLRELVTRKSFCFISLDVRPPKCERKRFDHLWGQCLDSIQLSMDEHKQIMSFFGVNVSVLLMAYLRSAIYRKMTILNGQVWALKKIFQLIKPVAVFAQHSLGECYALGEICKDKKIPAILISHGSHVPHSDKMAKIEWDEHARTLLNTHYPYVAIQTPWAMKFFNEQQQVFSTPIVTGPLLFAGKRSLNENREKLRARIFSHNSNKKILLHAGTPKPWQSFRPWVYETFGEYVDNINELINAAEQVPGVYLAIRFRPTTDMTTVEFVSLLKKSDCYDVYTKGSFDEYLLATDMLVSYSSTTIEEALQNRIPVLQYDPHAKYWHVPGEFVRTDEINVPTSVRCATTQLELIKVFRELVETKINTVDDIDWSSHIFSKIENFQWLNKLVS